MVRVVVGIVACLIVMSMPAWAQGVDRFYAPAEKSFKRLPEQQRFDIQWALVLGGFLKAPLSYDFNRDVYLAIGQAQDAHGWQHDGRVTPELMDELTQGTLLNAARLRFEPFAHPTEKIEILVPAGLDLESTTTKQGHLWHDEARTLAIAYRFIPKITLATQQEAFRRVREETGAEEVRRVVTKTFVDGILAHRDGSTTRSVYHRHKDGLIGFEISWKPERDRAEVARVMSVAMGSLAASLAKKPFSRFVDVLPQDQAEGFLGLSEALGEIPVPKRQQLQILMAAAGLQKAPPRDEISFDFISGILELSMLGDSDPMSEAQLHELWKHAEPQLAQWGFEERAHPVEGFPVWLPVGMNVDEKRHANGSHLAGREKQFHVFYNYFPSQDFDAGFRQEITSAAESKDEVKALWKKRDSYFIRGQMKNGGYFAKTYHRHKSGIMGLAVLWNPQQVPDMEPALLIMQASLAAAMEDRAFPKPGNIASWFPAPSEARAAPRDGGTSGESEGKGGGSGTGFFVSGEGHVLTNAHVVDGCGTIMVASDAGDAAKAELVARDATNDLALLKTELTGRAFVAFRTTARLGEGVAAFGFPLTGTLSSTGNFTLGNITALAGMHEDSRFNQVSAPVQPGNSGGPLLDTSGNLLGVVTAKLNALYAMKQTGGDIPQNVNFAIKPALAVNFLESHDLTPNVTPATEVMATADLADHARKLATFILCER